MTEEMLWGREHEERGWGASGLLGSWPRVWGDAIDQTGVAAHWEVLVGICVPEVTKQGRITRRGPPWGSVPSGTEGPSRFGGFLRWRA